MGSWKSETIAVNHIKLHYTRTGGDKPPLILAHGITDDGLCWTPLAEALEAEFDLLMPDARGHGRSDAPQSGYGPAAHAEDLMGLIEKLGLDHPYILGHSMGAMTALTLAAIHPQIPRAILLEDPPSWWMPKIESEESKAQRAQKIDWLFSVGKKTRNELTSEQRASGAGWSDAEIEPWADAKLRFSTNVSEVFQAENETSLDWQSVLPQIQCPALLIRADTERGALVTPESAAALQKLVPQLRTVHIPSAGHCIHREQFETYMKVIRLYLKEV